MDTMSNISPGIVGWFCVTEIHVSSLITAVGDKPSYVSNSYHPCFIVEIMMSSQSGSVVHIL